MGLIEEGLTAFFRALLGGVYSEIKRGYNQRYGHSVKEFKTLEDFSTAFQEDDLAGVNDVIIRKACLSNFAPLYLGYSNTQNEELRLEAKKAKDLYDSLRKDAGIKDNSLFVEAANGETELSQSFRNYATNKKMLFMSLSLARFKPLTENICYAALFKSGKKIEQLTSPITGNPHLEPCIPVFYDLGSFQEIASLSHIDVEISARLMPLPYYWESILRQRGIRAAHNSYCLFLSSRNKDHYAEVIEATTKMILDSWIVFQIPKLRLELPFFFRLEPENLQSRKQMAIEFQGIYNQLKSKNRVRILFYGDYIEPPIKKIQPIFSKERIDQLLHYYD